MERAAGARDRRARLARFETSLSGSCSRKTSMPFSAAHDTKRPTMSPLTGREPTRNRPRSAIPSGVDTRALIARIRSHGLSTRRRTVASKTPPPETSRHANPAPSRISATRRPRRSEASRRVAPARAGGSSCRPASARADLTEAPERARSGAADVATLARIDLDALAVSTNSGTWTTAPVSSVAGFVTFVTVSPRTAGSVCATFSSTEAGS